MNDDQFDKQFNRTFGGIFALGVLFSLAWLAALVTGIVIAWKHFA